MCGVAGILTAARPTGDDAAQVAAMLRTLRHRGPDGFSVAAFDNAVLGHARLAIIDLETGTQPIGNEDGSIQVILNGEIYNYEELRADLAASGHVFRTRSDTEVIPHLYEQLGDAFVERLRGMFVIALVDARRRRALLVRDRLGKKPLYYARTPRGTYFASEPRALTACDDVDRSVDPEALAHYLAWQYVPAPWSIYRGIRKLEAGTRMIVDGEGVRLERWWDDAPSALSPLDHEEALDRLRRTLGEACRIRLRSDVPLGAFLSGGIDSGIVSALARQARGAPLHALTVSFGDAADETPLARATARFAGLDHAEVRLDLDVRDVVEAVCAHLDEPHGDASCVPAWLVCKAARESVTVALSGDGGDETFAGYASRYAQQLMLGRVRRALPAGVRRSVFGSMARVWPRSRRLPRPLRLGRVLESAAAEECPAYVADRMIWRPRDLLRARTDAFAAAVGAFDPTEPTRRLFERCEGADPLEVLLFLDRRTYLAEGVLAKVDRMSMAHSLEVRSPLLDHEVVELSLRIRASDKIRGVTGKQILRELGSGLLPPEVLSARKSGFAPPLRAWLNGPLKALVDERLGDPAAFVAGVIRPDAIRRLVDQHRSGARDHGPVIWTMLVLELWAGHNGVRR